MNEDLNMRNGLKTKNEKFWLLNLEIRRIHALQEVNMEMTTIILISLKNLTKYEVHENLFQKEDSNEMHLIDPHLQLVSLQKLRSHNSQILKEVQLNMIQRLDAWFSLM